MTTIRFADIVLESEGDGEAVLMLPGLAGTSNTWSASTPALSGMRILRPDLPGMGRSPVPRSAPSLREIAESLVRILGHLGVARASVVGHSMGTLVAQHLAALRPELVERLVLFGPLLDLPQTARDRLLARAGLAREKGMDAVADQVLAVALAVGSQDRNPLAHAFVRETHMRQPAEGFALACETLARSEPADLGQIDCPVLAVTGDQDGVAPPSNLDLISAQVRGTRCAVLADCGHWSPIEKPQDCRRLIVEFLRGLRA